MRRKPKYLDRERREARKRRKFPELKLECITVNGVVVWAANENS